MYEKNIKSENKFRLQACDSGLIVLSKLRVCRHYLNSDFEDFNFDDFSVHNEMIKSIIDDCISELEFLDTQETSEKTE